MALQPTAEFTSLILVSILAAGVACAFVFDLVRRFAGQGAAVLGAGFLGFGVAFAAERSRDRASRLFLASIAYLPLLLGALALL